MLFHRLSKHSLIDEDRVWSSMNGNTTSVIWNEFSAVPKLQKASCKFPSFFHFYFQATLTSLPDIIATSFFFSLYHTKERWISFSSACILMYVCERCKCVCVCVSASLCHCLSITCLWKCSSDCSVSGAEATNFTIITTCVADGVITDVVRADLPLSWFNPPLFTRSISLLLTLNTNRPYNQPSRCRGRLNCSILVCSAHIRLLPCH